MENLSTLTLRLPEKLSPTRLCEAFDGRLEFARIETRHFTFWDTFEWGVWFGGCLLFSEGEEFRLCEKDEGWIGPELSREQIGGARPRFARDFKLMRESLSRLLGLRGLTPLVSGTFRIRSAELRNESGKIICRLDLGEMSQRRSREVLLRYCRVLPLRGYEADAEPVAGVIVGIGAEPACESPVELLFKNAGTPPREYTLRPAFGLAAESSARNALGGIVREMLALARSNEPGILRDIDTEFLHDYRICIRKIRSALGLIKEVYADEDIRRIRTALGDLARATNRLRDLDVYLLSREEYLSLLPPDFQPALEEMFRDFECERSAALRKVSSHLRSPSRCLLIGALDGFFREDASHPPSAASERPIGLLVSQSIYKRFKKVRKIAGRIGPDTPDEGLHDLRIQCKKLRYLMEFFTELIPQDHSDAMEKPLRRLQSRLGEFNDSSVQETALLEYWKRKHSAIGGANGLALSLGGLVSILYYRRKQHRDKIQEAIATFRCTSTAELFKQTFQHRDQVPAKLALP